MIDCNMCHGQGAVRGFQCPKCNGTGQVFIFSGPVWFLLLLFGLIYAFTSFYTFPFVFGPYL